VSRTTTTRAVKELENEGLIYRVRGKGTFVRENAEWRQNQQRSRLISFVVPFSREGGSGYVIVNGAEAQAARAQQLLTIHNSQSSRDRERQIILELMEHRIEGLVLFPQSSLENHDILSRLLIERIPLVLVDRRVMGIDASFVAVDNIQGMADMVRHLAGLGHRRIAYMGNTRTATLSEQDRFIGFCRGMVTSGIPLRDEYLCIEDEIHPPQGTARPHGHEILLAFVLQTLERLFALPDPPTAIAAVNDYTAMMVVKSALARGIAVPRKLSITGFDDMPMVPHLEVPLTTVAQPFAEIGETAVRMIQKLIADPDTPAETFLLPTQLVIRESTAAPDA
jgi:DNA-binding LacI/PurR family transcriptional regulator